MPARVRAEIAAKIGLGSGPSLSHLLMPGVHHLSAPLAEDRDFSASSSCLADRVSLQRPAVTPRCLRRPRATCRAARGRELARAC